MTAGSPGRKQFTGLQRGLLTAAVATFSLPAVAIFLEPSSSPAPEIEERPVLAALPDLCSELDAPEGIVSPVMERRESDRHRTGCSWRSGNAAFEERGYLRSEITARRHPAGGPKAAEAFQQAKEVLDAPVPVPGLGDEAFLRSNGRAGAASVNLVVRRGTLVIVIELDRHDGPAPRQVEAEAKARATTVLALLPR